MTTKMKPILMSTPMVQATLDGRKTVTRREVKLKHMENPKSIQPDGSGSGWIAWQNLPISSAETAKLYPGDSGFKCPYGKVGDILWVRETFRAIEQDYGLPRYEYKATEKINLTDKWKPSIFMPSEACRIFLEIVSISVERLQDITEEDAVREGIRTTLVENYRMSFNIVRDEWELYDPKLHFKELWQSINGLDSWDQNPWVWRIEYKRVDKPLTHDH